MANKLRGEVDVVVGDRTLTLYFGVNEMLALQEELGIEEDHKLFEELKNQITHAKGLRTVLRHMLLFRQPEMTLEDAGNVISELGKIATLEAITRCFSRSAPEPDPESRSGKGIARSPGTIPV